MRKPKKLQLKKETVRLLQAIQLRAAVAGVATPACLPFTQYPYTCAPCTH